MIIIIIKVLALAANSTRRWLSSASVSLAVGDLFDTIHLTLLLGQRSEVCFLVLLEDLVLLLFIGSRSHGQSAVGTRVGLDRRELLGLLILIVSPCRRSLDSFTNLIVFQILFVQIVWVLATRGDVLAQCLLGLFPPLGGKL